MHTGDLARIDARGYLFIVDRKKDMVISGGVNIYPREAEEVLARHPAVAEVAVYGIPDPLWGEALAATVVLRPGAQASADELLAFARGQLAGFKLPKQWQLADTLPKTATGKVQKTALRQRYAATS
jgi:acyl-CoA synthetase (AMP-forming)/AMP-acid ligase II